MMPNWLAVGLGGFVGAVLRYVVSGVMQRRFAAFLPAGTLAVNVVGCLVIGMAMTWFGGKGEHLSSWRFFLVTGVLGGFTTFSAFGWEVNALLHANEPRTAAWTIIAHLALCLAAVELGRLLAHRL